MIAEIVAKLEAEKAALGLKWVAGAAGFQQAAEYNPTAVPAAFVVLLDEAPGERQFSGNDIQKIDVQAGVIFAVSNASDPKGAAAQTDLKAIRDNVKESLLGWVPVTDYRPLERGRSTLMGFKDGYMWWQDIYLSSFYERKP
jgi:hypothetical protein